MDVLQEGEWNLGIKRILLMVTTLCLTLFVGSLQAEAKTINIAKGKRVFLEGNWSPNGSFGVPLTRLNDGNLDTVIQFYHYDYNPVYIDLGDRFVVEGFKIIAKNSGNARKITVQYYDSDMKLLKNISGYYQDLSKVSNVRYVSLYHVDKESLDVREFEVYGSDGSVSEVTGVKGNPDINKISLSWINPVEPNFKGVKIYKNNTLLATVDAGKNSYVVEGLEDNKNYEFKITTLDDKGTESVGVVDSFTTLIDPKKVPPGSVNSLKAEPTEKTVKLTWESPKDDDLSGFKISKDGKQVAEIGLQEQFEVNGLKPKTKYEFGVVAVDKDGNGSKVQKVEATTLMPVLDPPDKVSATSQNKSLIISWDKVDSPFLKGYNVYVNGKKVNSSPLTSNKLFVKNLENDTSYTVQVSAVNKEDVEGKKSKEVSEKPSSDALEVEYDVKMPFGVKDVIDVAMILLLIVAPLTLLGLAFIYHKPIITFLYNAIQNKKRRD